MKNINNDRISREINKGGDDFFIGVGILFYVLYDNLISRKE